MTIQYVTYTVTCDACRMRASYDFVPEDDVCNLRDFHDRLTKFGWLVRGVAQSSYECTYECEDCKKS